MEQSDPNPPGQPTVNGIQPKKAASDKSNQAQLGEKFASNIEPTPKHKGESYYTRPDPTPLWKILLEVAAFCVVLAYTIAAYRQLKTMREQLQQMKAASEQAKLDNVASITAQQTIAQNALIASQKSVDKSLAATIDNFHLDQRAWVGAVGASLDAVDVGKPLHISAVLLNSGKTAARKVNITFHWQLTMVPLDSLPTSNLGEPTGVQSIGVLVPSGRYDNKWVSPAPATDADKMRAGVGYTYIWGDVSYEDIFKKSHSTQTCTVRKGTGEFVQCPFHNEAD